MYNEIIQEQLKRKLTIQLLFMVVATTSHAIQSLKNRPLRLFELSMIVAAVQTQISQAWTLASQLDQTSSMTWLTFFYASIVTDTESVQISRKHFSIYPCMKRIEMQWDSSGCLTLPILRVCLMFIASSYPFILNATIKKHLDSSNDLISKHMKSDIYVNNLASGTANDNKAVNYFMPISTFVLGISTV